VAERQGRNKPATGWTKGNEKILEIERGSTGSHYVENWLWYRLRFLSLRLTTELILIEKRAVQHELVTPNLQEIINFQSLSVSQKCHLLK
jgi:hypothetical protein